MSPPMISKAAAHYTGAGGKEHCSLCRHFSPRRGGRCARVLGDISPRGWCRLFSREMRGLIADASSFNGGAGGPALSLDFIGNPGTLDPRITFTRASSATYFDSAGVMRNAGYNLVFPSVPVPPGNANWLCDVSTALTGAVSAPDGTNTAPLISATDTSNAIRSIRTVPATTVAASTAYTVSAYFKKAPAANVYIQINGVGASVAYFDLTAGTAVVGADLIGGFTAKSVTITAVSNNWYRCSFTFTTTGSTNALTTFIGPCTVVSPTGDNRSYVGVAGQGVYVWGVQIEAGSVTTPYVPTTTAANGAPRWDYDPATLQLRGLLLEEARTNILLNSGTLTGYAANNLTTTQAAGVAPDGTNTMVRLAETAVTNYHLLIAPLQTIVAATTYTLSVFAKAQQNRYFQLVIDDNVSNGGWVNFDLQTGTICSPATATGTGSNVAASIQPVGNGIYRCTLTAATNATTTGRFVFGLLSTPNGSKFSNYAGNAANGLLVWGAQAEAGAFATSYIPTTSAAVTRAADNCQILPANMGWFVSPGGSWFAEFIELSPAGDNRVVGFPTLNNRAQIYISSGRQAGIYDGSAAVTTVNQTTQGVISRAVSTYAMGTGRICLNGGSVAAAALTQGFADSAAWGTGFMQYGVPSDAMTGYLRAVRYYARILADSEMQAVTNNPAAILLPAPDQPDRPDNELPEAPPTPEPKDDPDGR